MKLIYPEKRVCGGAGRPFGRYENVDRKCRVCDGGMINFSAASAEVLHWGCMTEYLRSNDNARETPL